MTWHKIGGEGALNLRKPLAVVVVILVIYDLCVSVVWHQIGYHDGQFGAVFGLLTVLMSNFGLPTLFIVMVYKWRPMTVGGWWTLRAYSVCWFPLIINTVIDHGIYTHVTGYYHAMMISTAAGAMEGVAVGQFLVLVQCVWLTVFTSLFIAWRSWWARTYG